MPIPRPGIDDVRNDRAECQERDEVQGKNADGDPEEQVPGESPGFEGVRSASHRCGAGRQRRWGLIGFTFADHLFSRASDAQKIADR